MDEVTVLRTSDEQLVDMAVGLLRAEGIQARKHDHGLRGVMAITVDGLGEMEVRVPEKDAERARDILAVRFSKGTAPETDDFPNE